MTTPLPLNIHPRHFPKNGKLSSRLYLISPETSPWIPSPLLVLKNTSHSECLKDMGNMFILTLVCNPTSISGVSKENMHQPRANSQLHFTSQLDDRVAFLQVNSWHSGRHTLKWTVRTVIQLQVGKMASMRKEIFIASWMCVEYSKVSRERSQKPGR